MIKNSLRRCKVLKLIDQFNSVHYCVSSKLNLMFAPTASLYRGVWRGERGVWRERDVWRGERVCIKVYSMPVHA